MCKGPEVEKSWTVVGTTRKPWQLERSDKAGEKVEVPPLLTPPSSATATVQASVVSLAHGRVPPWSPTSTPARCVCSRSQKDPSNTLLAQNPPWLPSPWEESTAGLQALAPALSFLISCPLRTHSPAPLASSFLSEPSKVLPPESLCTCWSLCPELGYQLLLACLLLSQYFPRVVCVCVFSVLFFFFPNF